MNEVVVRGVVQRGRTLGRTLGFPTANQIIPKNLVAPARGVYVCRASFEENGESRVFPGVLNVGVCPTLTQSELAAKIEIDVSTLSRFISNATGKLSDENIKKIAKEFEVSTDFLLGVTDIPDRMNYDIGELGLSVQAAKNLYTGKVNAEVVNRLLENKNFAAMTNMIAHYFDDTLAAGYAAQNQMYATLSALLMGEAKQHPEDREAIAEAAKTVSVSRMPMYQADLTAIQNTFLNVLKEIKKEIGSNVSDAQAMSKEAAQQMYAELTKGQDVTKPNVTPEMIAGAITGSVSGMDGVDPEALKQFNQALIGLLTVKPTEDEHDGS